MNAQVSRALVQFAVLVAWILIAPAFLRGKAQAAKKFSAIHFIKRKNFVNDCMGYNAQAKVVKKHTPKHTVAR